MSSTDRGRGGAPGKQKEPLSSGSATPDSAEAFPDWMDRMQRARARHAAITRNLNTWSSYKTWADRMRESWDEDERQAESNSNSASKSPAGR